MSEVYFFNEEVNFSLKNAPSIKEWILKIIAAENKEAEVLNFIFCSDQYLYELNTTYLHHDTFTDILTFDHSQTPGSISGDIFLSIDRITENAKTLSASFEQELFRVMIHGILHLLGYSDKNQVDKQQMRKKEEACLSLLSF